MTVSGIEASVRDRLPGAGPVLWWAFYLLLYLSFVSPLAWTQAVAGAILSAIAVGLSRLGMRTAGLRLAGAAPKVWRLRAVARILALEATAVAGALVRQLRGGRRVRGRFVAVRVGEPVDPAADAAITLEAAVAPNTYVVALFEDEDLLLVHQFEARQDVRGSFPRWAR